MLGRIVDIVNINPDLGAWCAFLALLAPLLLAQPVAAGEPEAEVITDLYLTYQTASDVDEASLVATDLAAIELELAESSPACSYFAGTAYLFALTDLASEVSGSPSAGYLADYLHDEFWTAREACELAL